MDNDGKENRPPLALTIVTSHRPGAEKAWVDCVGPHVSNVVTCTKFNSWNSKAEAAIVRVNARRLRAALVCGTPAHRTMQLQYEVASKASMVVAVGWIHRSGLQGTAGALCYLMEDKLRSALVEGSLLPVFVYDFITDGWFQGVHAVDDMKWVALRPEQITMDGPCAFSGPYNLPRGAIGVMEQFLEHLYSRALRPGTD
jgi:hypothetical protein